jgi:hypothetical protein
LRRRLETFAHFIVQRRVDAAFAGEPRAEFGVALRLLQRFLKAPVRRVLIARTVGAEDSLTELRPLPIASQSRP